MVNARSSSPLGTFSGTDDYITSWKALSGSGRQLCVAAVIISHSLLGLIFLACNIIIEMFRVWYRNISAYRIEIFSYFSPQKRGSKFSLEKCCVYLRWTIQVEMCVSNRGTLYSLTSSHTSTYRRQPHREPNNINVE